MGITLMLIGFIGVFLAWAWAFFLTFAHENIEKQLPYMKIFMTFSGGAAYPIFILQALELAGSTNDISLKVALVRNFKLMVVGLILVVAGAIVI